MNICSPEIWSRYRMHCELAMKMKENENIIKKIKLYDLPEMAGRPLNTSMVCNRLKNENENQFVKFRESINKVAKNYK